MEKIKLGDTRSVERKQRFDQHLKITETEFALAKGGQIVTMQQVFRERKNYGPGWCDQKMLAVCDPPSFWGRFKRKSRPPVAIIAARKA